MNFAVSRGIMNILEAATFSRRIPISLILRAGHIMVGAP